MSEEITAQQRIARLDELERAETHRSRIARRRTWTSVGLAAALLAGLVFWAHRDLANVRQRRDAAQEQLAKVEKERDAAKQQLADLDAHRKDVERQLKDAETALAQRKAALAASIGALSRVDAKQLRSAVEQEVTADPNAAQLLPRVYLQIVDQADRGWAERCGKLLQQAGIIPLGVEYVPRAAGLRRTDVRYYKQAERAGAERIVEILRTAGVVATLNYLNQEHNTNVRPNHFEVWFAPGVGRTAPSTTQ